ncbi:hypothetical protein AC629_40910 [Bradyrhizobium sp. NAS80.1]|nr:hypothetical protein AC629_40910 [Bradyrhizobium sp. NAS80.1]
MKARYHETDFTQMMQRVRKITLLQPGLQSTNSIPNSVFGVAGESFAVEVELVLLTTGVAGGLFEPDLR